ncbi:hypothetical protein BU14_2904s0001 [Porphyra umbilicalis]|uniref:Uncharacterized protein n=1 Tax=Porphyra umbilicalis TaxID=2786 RepID=A0A1X6NID1_PORUM|nr:hypothetical protein BU14_2904s0001 [Porphyra umbilicalis]|eukprot:OSX68381.1 hypothetical protein BU14_2904s0001 [Porphyra umbilicalis]
MRGAAWLRATAMCEVMAGGCATAVPAVDCAGLRRRQGPTRVLYRRAALGTPSVPPHGAALGAAPKGGARATPLQACSDAAMDVVKRGARVQRLCSGRAAEHGKPSWVFTVFFERTPAAINLYTGLCLHAEMERPPPLPNKKRRRSGRQAPQAPGRAPRRSVGATRPSASTAGRLPSSAATCACNAAAPSKSNRRATALI